MVYKSFQGSDISHIRYPITKRRTIVSGSGIDGIQYDYFLTQSSSPSIYQLAGLQRYISNNNAFMEYQTGSQKILKSLEGGYFPSEMFSIEHGQISLLTSSISTILFINHITSMDPERLISLSIITGGADKQFYISNSILYDDQNYTSLVGLFVPNINAILFTGSYASDKWKVEIQYNFEIHEFEYMCNIQPGEFNKTLNVTAYTKSETTSQFYMLPNVESTYITSIGLYDDQNILMAIAKLSSPIRVSNVIDTTVIVELDYIP